MGLGGELVLFPYSHVQGDVAACAGEPVTVVAPIADRLVVFDSRVEHMVLPNKLHR